VHIRRAFQALRAELIHFLPLLIGALMR